MIESYIIYTFVLTLKLTPCTLYLNKMIVASCNKVY